MIMAKKKALIAISLLFPASALAEVEVVGTFTGVSKDVADETFLELHLKVPPRSGSDSGYVGRTIVVNEVNDYGYFVLREEISASLESESMYFFGVLKSDDGTGAVRGLLPLEFRNLQDPTVAPTDSYLDLGRSKIFHIDEENLGIGGQSCWKNEELLERGKAARASDPFLDPVDLSKGDVNLTLLAIRDMIEHRLINTCPTWNRLRGIIRGQRIFSVWGSMPSERLEKVLDYLERIYNLTATSQDFRQIPKIYNDVLLELIAQGADGLVFGQDVRDFVLSRQIGIFSSHTREVIWRFDNSIDQYRRTGNFERCMRFFIGTYRVILNNNYFQNMLIETEGMRRNMYRALSDVGACADETDYLPRTEELTLAESGEKANKIIWPSEPQARALGMEFMNSYLDFLRKSDQLSGPWLPTFRDDAEEPGFYGSIIFFKEKYLEYLNNQS